MPLLFSSLFPFIFCYIIQNELSSHEDLKKLIYNNYPNDIVALYLITYNLIHALSTPFSFLNTNAS